MRHEFKPYHEQIIQQLRMIDPRHQRRLNDILALARLAQGVIVPREHRASVIEAFDKMETECRSAWRRDYDEANDGIIACQEVKAALWAQDKADEEQDQKKAMVEAP